LGHLPIYPSARRQQPPCISVYRAAVLLLLPDDLLADIDAARHEPRLVWIRSAITDKLGNAPTHSIRGAPERSVAPSPVAAPRGNPGYTVDPPSASTRGGTRSEPARPAGTSGEAARIALILLRVKRRWPGRVLGLGRCTASTATPTATPAATRWTLPAWPDLSSASRGGWASVPEPVDWGRG
jgi:hypothetical protein